MSGLEVRGQKIPTPANENSTDFQLGTDDTKGSGYTGVSMVNIVPLAIDIFTVLTLKFALDSTLESVKKISSMGWEMDSFVDCFSISFFTKEIVPKSNINRSKSENYKRCFHRNKTISSRWSKLEWRLQVEEAWKIVAWLTCLSSFLQPDKKN